MTDDYAHKILWSIFGCSFERTNVNVSKEFFSEKIGLNLNKGNEDKNKMCGSCKKVER